jgi:uncharacterized SAM-binding protein YcdF (DUF218 family)
MIKYIVIVVLTIALIIIGLSVYLSPDDLRQCHGKITGTSPCEKVDAIVAVSGGDTAARTASAIELYQHGWAPLLIFSGAAEDKSGPSNASAMRLQAVEAGVPESAIIIEQYSETTKQNAEKTQTIFDEKGIKSIILVTSGYHQKRASLEFHKRAGGEVAIYNHPDSNDKDWSSLWWVTPRGWYLAVGEFVKTLVFYAGGTR